MPKPKSMSQAEYDEPQSSNNETSDLDPLIEALLEHLPPRGEAFPGRKLWMQIMDLALTLIYPEEAPGGGQST